MKDVYSRCQSIDGTGPLTVDLYYGHGGPTLTAKLELANTSPDLDVDAPALGDPPERDVFGWGRRYELGHAEENVTLRGGRGTVTRNNLYFTISPRGDSHATGTYGLKLSSSGPLSVHLWCQGDRECGFKVGASPPPEVFVRDRF
jgi:hypothetical protein